MTEKHAEYNTEEQGQRGECLTCGKPFPVTKEGRRFCHPKCRMAYWRSLGKTVPTSVQSVTNCSDGGTVIVLRAGPEHATQARAHNPKNMTMLMPNDSEAS